MARFSFVQEEDQRSRLTSYKDGISDSWVKALTELITNSHQNYHDMFQDPKYSKPKIKPAIIIFADPNQEMFVVRDYAMGIAQDDKELKDLLFKYSAYIKKSHTPQGRSSFGRGMSDVLFRQRDYTNQLISHKNGKCIAALAHWTKNGPTFEEDPDVTEKQIKTDIPEHGTQVTFQWKSETEKKNFPSKLEIMNSISKYYELKNVLNDSQIDVMLLYRDGSPNQKFKKLEFVNYHKSAELLSEKSDLKPLNIDPNYDIRVISAKICRAKVPLSQQRGESRTGGLFIEGEHGQVYDLTLFGFESGYRDASVRVIGEVILSEDAKRFMDDYYTKHSETMLTRTREGFKTTTKFYRKLNEQIGPWLEKILESESEKSMSVSSDRLKSTIKLLNQIGRDLLEAKNLESGEDDEGTGQKKKKKKFQLPDTIEFSPKSPKIEQGVLCSISLKINCERIKPGTKVDFSIHGAERANYNIRCDTDRVPKGNRKGLAKIPILIKCNEIGSAAEICAVTSTPTEKVEKWCDLTCIEETDGPYLPKLNEYLEFVPKETSVETNVDKRVILWAHQMLDTGTKIKIEFTCQTHDVDPPITFAEDGNQKISKGTHSFEIEVPDIEPEENAYRKIPITFTGTQEGLKGKITASSDHKKTIPTTCQIEIQNENEQAGGLLSGWEIVNSAYPMYAWYEKEDTKVHINVGIPFVRKILGKDGKEAEARIDKLQEAQVFVAHTMMDTFFDEVTRRMFETRKYVFDLVDPTFQESHDDMVFRKQGLMADYGKEILESVAPNIRTKAIGGEVNVLNFSREGLEFKYWPFDLEQNIVPPISFNDLAEFRGKTANLTPVHFEVGGQTFEVGVYEFDGKFVVKMHNYDKDGKYKVVMPEIDKMLQIFRAPKQACKKVSLEDPVFSAVKVACWVRHEDPNKRLILEPVKYDQYDKIIEPPEMNHANYLLESSSNWRNIQGEPLIEYAKYSDIDQSYASSDKKYDLACFVSSGHTIQMAKMFVRTKVAPAFVEFNNLIKTFKDAISECENKKCDERAEGVQEIFTKKGFHREGGNMVINKLCRNCQ